MKKLALWLALPLVAFAGVRDDYASQWPLTLERNDAGAYRVVLDRGVYRQLQSPRLQDLVVVNAGGVPVATAVFPPDAPLAQAGAIVELPWFRLPANAGSPTQDIAAISEISADGILRRVELHDPAKGATGAADHGFVIDASQVRVPLAALRLSWSDSAPFDRGYRVSVSDDLKQWRPIEADGRLVQLQDNGRRVVEDRIVLPAVQAKYLRLLPEPRQPTALAVTGIRAELTARIATQALQWEELQGRRVETREGTAFEYTLAGRFPMQAADVVSPGNSTRSWVLESRDDAQSAWQPAAAPWVAYRIDSGSTSSRSPPQPLHGTSRHRQWRLLAREAGADVPPVLRLGYRPEVVVFLAEGGPPFSLLAGSGRAVRQASPLPQLVEALRVERGPGWQPAGTVLGGPQPLAGEAALQPLEPPIDWKRWLLWGLLVAGAVLVAGFALSLLRGKPAD